MSIISPETRAQVLELLDRSALDKNAVAFMDTVNHQLATIQKLKLSLENTFTDRDAQDEIVNLLEQAARFRGQLESLDPEIQPVLALYLHTPTPYTAASGEASEFVTQLEQDLEILIRRLEIITTLGSVEDSRNWLERYLWHPLIADILYAYWEHFGEYPSVQKNGVIEKILRLLVATVVEPPGELHSLIVTAVERQRNSEPRPLKDS